MVNVTGGVLSEAQVISEFQRLVSNKWNWEIIQTRVNCFKTSFPPCSELDHMLEWGVQTKRNASMKIEESVIREKAKVELKKVWVQFIGLPSVMIQFLLIWVVGSILGVTKAVDIKFTNKFDVCQLEVSVLDPNLIPQYVDVIIGDFVYELQFKADENINEENPEPMDMDSLVLEMMMQTCQGVRHQCHNARILLGNKQVGEESSGAKIDGVGSHGKKVSDSKVTMGESMLMTAEIAKLAVVLEASVGSNVTQRSNTSFKEGMSNTCSSLRFSFDNVMANLQPLGFKFTNDSCDVQNFIESIIQSGGSSSLSKNEQEVADRKIAKEENEFYERDELNKLFLSNLCSEVLEEVLDTKSEHNHMARTTIYSNTNKKGRRKNLWFQNERVFWNSDGDLAQMYHPLLNTHKCQD
jgi:hypothetical protein